MTDEATPSLSTSNWLDGISWLFGLGANLAAIITAVIAVWVWLWFRAQRVRRRRRLEQYLREVKLAGDGMGQRTVLHLIGNLRMTEAQVFEAAFDSKVVVTVPGQDHTGIANRIYFQYTTGDPSEDLRLAGGGRRDSRWRPYAR
ncbi:MAG: hypothetical protein EON59_10755 [Alphaproteobacteria bacterium]|nr:MAG: hypothetical protein EON59_10755 [Alphaproteobacteria bacterium]